MKDDSGAIKRMKRLDATQFWQAAQAGNLAIDAVLLDIHDIVAELETARSALVSQPQPEGEAVAWRWAHADDPFYWNLQKAEPVTAAWIIKQPLYLHPAPTLQGAGLIEARKSVPLSEAPPPDLLIEYPNGSVTALMFHFATESDDVSNIARDAGFEIKGYHLDSDDDELWAEYEAGGNCDTILPRWNPEPPEGFRLAAKWDSEDGPVAWFIRETVADAALSPHRGAGE